MYHIDHNRISKFIKQNMSQLKTQEKRVLQKTKDGDIIKEWSSIGIAAKELNLKYSEKIGLCANGKRKTAYGFIWEWVN